MNETEKILNDETKVGSNWEIQYTCSECNMTIFQSNLLDPSTRCIHCHKLGTYEPIQITEPAMLKAQVMLGTAYEGITGFMRRYLDLDDDYYQLVAMWIIGTYMHSNFSSFPFLFINAMRGSGKTRLLNIISHLSKGSNGEVQTGVSEAVLFRSEKGSTLVLDECEAIASKEKATLREYLNASYKKGSTVKRTKKVKKGTEETYVIDKFEPYRPIAMANINGMDDVLGDRCLTLILEKSNNPKVTKMLEDFQDNPEIQALKTLIRTSSVVMSCRYRKKQYITLWNTYINNKYRDIMTYTTLTTLNDKTTLDEYEDEEDLRSLFNKIDEMDIDGRNLELIFPLLIIARSLSLELVTTLLEIVKRIISNKKTNEFSDDKDVSLIDFVSQQERSRFEYISLNELVRRFRDFLGEMDDEDRWLNAKWLGKALKRLNLIGSKKRVARGREVILNVDSAKQKIKMFKSKEDKDETS